MDILFLKLSKIEIEIRRRPEEVCLYEDYMYEFFKIHRLNKINGKKKQNVYVHLNLLRNLKIKS